MWQVWLHLCRETTERNVPLVKLDSGETYEGEWLNGKLHGRGIWTCSRSGERYEGDWVDGKKHGRGIFTWRNKNR